MVLMSHSTARIFAVAVLVTALSMTSIATAQDATTITVTSVTCKNKEGMCINGSTLTIALKGDSSEAIKHGKILTLNDDYDIKCAVKEDMQSSEQNPNEIKCTLMFTDVPDGEYKITIPLSKANVTGGYLRVGKFLEAKIETWLNVKTSQSAKYAAYGFDNTWPSTGDTLGVYGHFDISENTYDVIFYNTEDDLEGTSSGMPKCSTTRLSQDKLLCTIDAKANMMGMYRIVILGKNTQHLLPGTTVQQLIAVNPPLPVVTTVSGECASQSARCTTGATLTFAGANFNTRSIKYNKVLIGRTDTLQKTLICDVTDVNTATMTCKLTIVDDVPPGAYPIHLRTQVCSMGMMTPLAPAGYLVVHGKESDKGWITATESLSLFAVDSVVPSVVRDGDTVTITGNFSASQQYNIEFSQTAAPYIADASHNATCNIATVTASSITCTFTTNELTKSSRYLLVYNVNHTYYLAMNRTKQSPVALYPKTPQINNASGDCATSSDACRNGATLTLIGDGFNPSDTAANRVSLAGLEEASCNVVAVSKDSITCQLTMRSDVTGVYQLQVQTRVTDNEWSAPTAAGSVVLNGGAGVPGWSIGAVPLSPMKGGTTNNIAAVACSIVFGVLFLIVVIALIVICCRYSFVRRGKQSAQDAFWNTHDTHRSETIDSPHLYKNSN